MFKKSIQISIPLLIFTVSLVLQRIWYHGFSLRKLLPHQNQTSKHRDIFTEQYISKLNKLKPYDQMGNKFLQWFKFQCHSRVFDPKFPLCECLPTVLYGAVPTPVVAPSWKLIIENNTSVISGGMWKPLNCHSRERVAIIIPARNQEEHLRLLLYHTHTIWQRQELDYRVFVVEQSKSGAFNKALMMNAAYIESRELFNFSCVIFHDVDMLLQDDRSFYRCGEYPRHLAASIDKYRYKLPYEEFIGGVIAIRTEHFELVNGFSNVNKRWGEEYDNLYHRFHRNDLHISRFPMEISRYRMIPHAMNEGDHPEIVKAEQDQSHLYKKDGLNSAHYRVLDIKEFPLYTWIHAETTCRMGSKPLMGKSLSNSFAKDILSLDNCKAYCEFNPRCLSISWDMTINLCKIHDGKDKLEMDSEYLFYKKICSSS